MSSSSRMGAIGRLMIGFGAVVFLAGCGAEARVPATDVQLAALPYTFEVPGSFAAYDVGEGKVTLQGPGSGTVAATVEIDVQLLATDGEFPPEKLVLGRWDDLRGFSELDIDDPKGGHFAGKIAIQLAATATNMDTNQSVRFEQWVSKQGRGYARMVAFADSASFEALEGTFEAIAASVKIKR